jgi:5-methyltetrahydropteroyltriglutamate--homocysteine methyltransferase
MRTSRDNILTTHVGNLPGRHQFSGDAAPDDAQLRAAVAAVVQKQRDTGLDVINEGEFTKGGDWLTYIDGRLGGFEVRSVEGEMPIIAQGKDREVFADFYKEANARGTLFYAPTHISPSRRRHWICTGPITYQAQAALTSELEMFRRAYRHGGRAVLHVYRASELRALSQEQLLSHGRRISFCLRRSDAHRVRNDRRRRLRAAGRRRLAGGAVGPHRHPDGT